MRYKQVKQSKCCSQESVKIGEVLGVARQRASPVAVYEGKGSRCYVVMYFLSKKKRSPGSGGRR